MTIHDRRGGCNTKCLAFPAAAAGSKLGKVPESVPGAGCGRKIRLSPLHLSAQIHVRDSIKGLSEVVAIAVGFKV